MLLLLLLLCYYTMYCVVEGMVVVRYIKKNDASNLTEGTIIHYVLQHA